MIIGVGVDNMELGRFERAAKSQRFLAKCFTDTELDLARRKGRGELNFLAGNFAAKEAIVKAIGTGFRFWPRDIEVLRDGLGRPVCYYDVGGRLHVSISHSRENVVAIAIIESVNEV